MHSVVLSYWCITCFWLLVIQWISGTCWDTMDILSCSFSTLSRNHFFICFELSNLLSSLTYLVESLSIYLLIYYSVMAPSPRVVHSLATSLNIFKTLFTSHFDILRGENVFVFPASSKHSIQHTLDIQLTDIWISEWIHGSDKTLGHPMSGVTDTQKYIAPSLQLFFKTKPTVIFADSF